VNERLLPAHGAFGLMDVQLVFAGEYLRDIHQAGCRFG
jgi:hypothetical protein